MPSPFPLRPSIDHTPRSRSVFELGDGAAPVLDALGNSSARDILHALDDEPSTVSDLADDLGMSLQNVQYHLDRLRETDLVTEVGTWYSSKGREMSVYAPATERLEIAVATDRDGPVLVRRPTRERTPIESD